MCGILAITGKNPSADAAQKGIEALHHRGPDDRGILAFPSTILGATRLAFVDLSPLGHQPMKDNTRNIAISFNGEIYNYKELRAELEAKGHHFTSRSDTEVILKAYIEYGHEAPVHLNGMFAFAIWDEEKQELFLARDRFGEKPMYFAHDPMGRLVVASEIKALFAAGVRGEIDPAGIDLYLALMYIPPWRTVYKNVHVVMPAHCGVYKNGAMEMSQYWELKRKPLSISYDDAKNKLRALLKEVIPKRLIADVEVGSFLSGGVDSTLVTAYAQEGHATKLKTFSLGYGDYINELPYADEAAKVIGTEHRTLQAHGDVTQELEKVLTYFDEPHGDSADLAQHMLSQETAHYVKAALAGDGGDELFLGYGLYWQYWHTRKLTRIWNFFFSNPFKAHLRTITVFPERMRRQFAKNASAVGAERIDKLVASVPGNGIEKINLFDITTYLPGQLLSKVDQASMMHSLEVRCPFLDYKLAEFAFNLPESYKTDRNNGKLILKDLLAEIMPRAFVDRKKQGFGAPVRRWLQEEKMRAYADKKFSPNARIYEYLREDVVRKLIKKTYASQDPKNYYRLWVLLCLAIWLEKHPS